MMRLLVLLGVVLLSFTACEDDDYAQFSEEVDKANQMLEMMQKHQTSRFSPQQSAAAYDAIKEAKQFAGKYQFDMAQEELDNFYRFANAAMSDSMLVLKRDTVHGIDPGTVVAKQVLRSAPVKKPVIVKAKPKATVRGKVVARKTVSAKPVNKVPLEMLAGAPDAVSTSPPKRKLEFTLVPFETTQRQSKKRVSKNNRVVTVKRGDWLMKIARSLGKKDLYALEIYKANKDILADPDVIEIGQQLVLP